MKLRVLSAGGSVGPNTNVSCFLVGEHLLIDAGTAASRLSFSEQRELRDVLITHAHLDHVRDIPFLCENLFGRGDHPLAVHGDPTAIDRLKRNLFNGELWPDFTQLPPEAPILELHPFDIDRVFRLQDLEIHPIAMPHLGGSFGFLLDTNKGALAITGDTGPGSKFWREIAPVQDRLRGILVECSFPNRLEELALQSGHLCPRLLHDELSHMAATDCPIHVYGIKGPTRDETVAEIASWADRRIEILEDGRVLEF
jgi:cAMP phosphodiesterase